MKKSLLYLVLIVSVFLTGCTLPEDSSEPSTAGHLEVHIIDAGQGDSILIRTSSAAFLIDGSTRDSGQKVVDYIQGLGIEALDGLVGTHPHEDHIGGLTAVLKNIPVRNVYITNVTHTTRTFEDFIAAINASGARKIQVKPGVEVQLEDIGGVFLGPLGTYEGDLNNQSAIFKLTYGSTSFLFTGDAEKVAEADLVKQGGLAADVLKVGHHGSSTSTSKDFLQAVAPAYVAISCGKDNSYGHPHRETMALFAEFGLPVYRTDENGTILFVTDGENISVTCEVEPVKAAGKVETIVYVTENGTKYHLENCSNLKKSKIPVELGEAREKYGPCGVCQPPV